MQAGDAIPSLSAMTAATVRCVECQEAARGARRCPDCREPVHQRCQAGHACPPKRARVAALAAQMAARLVRYRAVLTLQVDSARGSPDWWDWSSCLGLSPAERVVVEVTRRDEACGDGDSSTRVDP
jgi:hypothetical protein